MKRSLIVICTIAVFTSLTSCGGQEEISDNKSSKAKLIYEENDLSVFYTGFSKKDDGVSLDLLIENNSDKKYKVQTNDFYINDYFVNDIFSIEIAAGKKINDNIKIEMSELEKNDLSYGTVETVEFSFNITDENGENAFDSPPITLNKRTEQSENENQKETEESVESKNSSKLPFEIKSFSYKVDGDYLYYSACLHNPNENYFIQLPQCRITARDENGEVLGTESIGLMGIYPNTDSWDGGQLFSIDKEPATVDIEVIETQENHYIEKSLTEFPDFKQLSVTNASLRNEGDKFVGEIQNDNDFSIDCVAVTIVFKDEEGNPVAADRTFVDNVSANTSTPFEKSLYVGFVTDNFDVYADMWY